MTDMQISPEEFRARMLEVLCYLLTSARGLIYEPRLYGPLRLAEGARRLILLMDEAGLADPEWRATGEAIEHHAMQIITDEEAAKEIIDELVLRLTAQLKAL